jgi:hypothetical protein
MCGKQLFLPREKYSKFCLLLNNTIFAPAHNFERVVELSLRRCLAFFCK